MIADCNAAHSFFKPILDLTLQVARLSGDPIRQLVDDVVGDIDQSPRQRRLVLVLVKETFQIGLTKGLSINKSIIL